MMKLRCHGLIRKGSRLPRNIRSGLEGAGDAYVRKEWTGVLRAGLRIDSETARSNVLHRVIRRVFGDIEDARSVDPQASIFLRGERQTSLPLTHEVSPPLVYPSSQTSESDA